MTKINFEIYQLLVYQNSSLYNIALHPPIVFKYSIYWNPNLIIIPFINDSFPIIYLALSYIILYSILLMIVFYYSKSVSYWSDLFKHIYIAKSTEFKVIGLAFVKILA